MKNFLKQINKNYQENFFSNGFTLIETLVAISIFTMSILGLMSVIASGITDTSYAKQKMAASYLAQEGIEYVRNMRDTSVLSNPSGSQAGWDRFKASEIEYPITDSDFTGFTRKVLIEEINPDEVRISSTVLWKQGRTDYNITFSENLFNWIE
ncbi:MAG: prepilin-type N-terminal cleavage/methylation domain-containing protein [Candidatus Paceibacterota bacterium]|jgi:prepilin-type N-terminal cleavage/methylation domain-containing protein